MAKIIDPDFLSQGTEIVFDTTARTIRLLKAGNLSDDGATLQAVYSFCKEEWKDDPDLIKLPFPMEAITEAKFDLINGWDWYKTTSETIEPLGEQIRSPHDGGSQGSPRTPLRERIFRELLQCPHAPIRQQRQAPTFCPVAHASE